MSTSVINDLQDQQDAYESADSSADWCFERAATHRLRGDFRRALDYERRGHHWIRMMREFEDNDA